MLIDLGRNDVGRVAATGSVKVTERMVIERYSHVMHIVSNVEGRLARAGRDRCPQGELPRGHGDRAPKVRAMQIIDELEPVKRGVYSGAVGYLGFNGDMDVAIAIRTAVVKDRRLNVQAAAGIVATRPALGMAGDAAQGAGTAAGGGNRRHRSGHPELIHARERVRELRSRRCQFRDQSRDLGEALAIARARRAAVRNSKPRNLPSRAIIDSTSGSVKRCSCTWNSRSRQPLML